MTEKNKDGYIIEFVSMGTAMKVTAIDTVSGREVSMIGDPKASRQELTRLAIDKLKYVLEKDKGA